MIWANDHNTIALTGLITTEDITNQTVNGQLATNRPETPEETFL
jgi:hypothetical protein